MPKYPFDAVIFDLDGVITQTALVHSRSWKKVFDEYLRLREMRDGETFREFTHDHDYRVFVDGRPRYEGVEMFLKSRGIVIPKGSPDDDPSAESFCGLGNRKNDAFNEVLASEGVRVYPSTVRFMRDLRDAGIRVGVASSSKNCYAVLEAAGLLDLVETRVDGVVSAEIGLKGKPEPDIFLTACANLGAIPGRAVVVEDASSGVAAGKKGNFALVLGLAREDNTHELLMNGADVVVDDLQGTSLDTIASWIGKVKEEDGWTISYYDYDPKKERTRESQLAIGNAYLGSRGAMEESAANVVNYPGTYMAGLYNRLISVVSGRDVANEDFVNCPNWLACTFRVGDGDWFDFNTHIIREPMRRLDFRNGLLTRSVITEDSRGNKTRVFSERFISMADPHLMFLRYAVTPLNYSGKISFKAGLDGAIVNAGVERYKSLNQKHLSPVSESADAASQTLVVMTSQSDIRLAMKAVYSLSDNGTPLELLMDQEIVPAAVSGIVSFDVQQGQTYTLVKKVALYSSKRDDVTEPEIAAGMAVSSAEDFDAALAKSAMAWAKIWDNIDIRLEGDRLSQKLLRFNLYHLMVSMSPHNTNLDASITARGLHGEAYRGHIFWDELFIMPFYCLTYPEVAKSMLLYRYRRLGKAREYAAAHHYKGAMFPWQSGSDGREETQVIHLNPLSGSWDPDHSCLQRHVSLAIAYNVWQYYQLSGDLDFMKQEGGEMFLEIARFWVSKAVWNEVEGRYDIPKVMGPDEFHEQYPGAAEGGISNNAYTNIMVSWMLSLVPGLLKSLGEDGLKLRDKILLEESELQQWATMATKLKLDISEDGIIAQYEGYFGLKELDWEHYRNKYGNVYRMDRILKSEGLSPDEFKVAKQADTLMTFYNLEKAEVDKVLTGLSYHLPNDYLQRNLDYYLARTSHGSTLSRLVHARLAAMAGLPELSRQFFADALASDFVDIQGGTTGEGIHAGVMGGAILVTLTTFGGISFQEGKLNINSTLPTPWTCLAFQLHFRGTIYKIVIERSSLTLLTDKDCQIIVNDSLANIPAHIQIHISI